VIARTPFSCASLTLSVLVLSHSFQLDSLAQVLSSNGHRERFDGSQQVRFEPAISPAPPACYQACYDEGKRGSCRVYPCKRWRCIVCGGRGDRKACHRMLCPFVCHLRRSPAHNVLLSRVRARSGRLHGCARPCLSPAQRRCERGSQPSRDTPGVC
jgi:hypothetical protein